jgi:large subunit ribosomal protein L25
LPAAAYSHIVELQTQKGNINTLIRHVQRDHRNGQVLNIEFYRVATNRKLTVTVPLKYTGTSPAVQAGGQLMENFTECTIECLPGDIPDFIEVDISRITELDHGLHFSQLNVPKNVVITNPPEETVCRVVSPKAVVEEAPAAEAAPAAEPAAAGAAS